MTINELMTRLQELENEFGPETEVRLAQQPNWPFEYSIGELGATEGETPVVYLAEGSQLGYLSGEAAEAVGWG